MCDPGLFKCFHLSRFVLPSVSDKLDQALAHHSCADDESSSQGGQQPLRSLVLALSANDLRATCLITRCLGSPTFLYRMKYLAVCPTTGKGVIVTEQSVHKAPRCWSERGTFYNYCSAGMTGLSISRTA